MALSGVLSESFGLMACQEFSENWSVKGVAYIHQYIYIIIRYNIYVYILYIYIYILMY